jgi:hypothetical protein
LRALGLPLAGLTLATAFRATARARPATERAAPEIVAAALPARLRGLALATRTGGRFLRVALVVRGIGMPSTICLEIVLVKRRARKICRGTLSGCIPTRR